MPRPRRIPRDLPYVGAFAVLAVLYTASMAQVGPWDPWETHYGEVARQILVRSDPLDLWWKPGSGGPHGNAENTFWSKPPLAFWAIALSFWAFGVGTSPDPAELVRGGLPEVALRLPGLLFGVATVAVVGVCVGRLVSRRAGWLAAWVLATMPQFALVSRQALTDIFALAPMAVAICAYGYAAACPDRRLATRRIGRWEVAWDRALLPAALLGIVFGLLPLLVLHVHVLRPYTVARIARLGRASGPGSAEALRAVGWHLAVYWGVAAAYFLRLLRLKSARRALGTVVLVGAGVSAMAKGLIGPGVVVATVLADLAVAGAQRVRVAQLEPLAGLLGCVLVVAPWHHAMWIFRGDRWVNEWIVVNNLARFGSGEQPQAVGDAAYYLEVLGPAAYPWSLLVPVAVGAAVGACLRRFGGGDAPAAPDRVWIRVLVTWTLVALWAISFSVTKYYHYLLPVLPPAAALAAVVLVQPNGPIVVSVGARGLATVFALGAGFAVLHHVHHEPAIFAHLTTYLYTGMWRRGLAPTQAWGWAGLVFILAFLPWIRGWTRAAAVTAALSGALVVGYLLNVYVPQASEHWSQRGLFRTYFARRTPEDTVVSWWFYYRGETYFTKGRIWVMKEPDRSKLADYLETRARAAPDAHVWFVTIQAHASRLSSHLPPVLRRRVEKVRENAHYVLLRVPLAPLSAQLRAGG